MRRNVRDASRAHAVNRRPGIAGIGCLPDVRAAESRVGGVCCVLVIRIESDPRNEPGARLRGAVKRGGERVGWTERERPRRANERAVGHPEQRVVGVGRRNRDRAHHARGQRDAAQRADGRPTGHAIVGAEDRVAAGVKPQRIAGIHRQRRDEKHRAAQPQRGRRESRSAVGRAAEVPALRRGVEYGRIEEVHRRITAVREQNQPPLVRPAGVRAQRRAVVLRASEVSLAVGRDRAVIELRHAVVVVERRKPHRRIGRVAGAGRPGRHCGARVVRAPDAAVVADEHLLVGRAVVLRVEGDEMLIGMDLIRPAVDQRTAGVIVSEARNPPVRPAVVRTGQIYSANPNAVFVRRINRDGQVVPALAADRVGRAELAINGRRQRRVRKNGAVKFVRIGVAHARCPRAGFTASSRAKDRVQRVGERPAEGGRNRIDDILIRRRNRKRRPPHSRIGQHFSPRAARARVNVAVDARLRTRPTRSEDRVVLLIGANRQIQTAAAQTRIMNLRPTRAAIRRAPDAC